LGRCIRTRKEEVYYNRNGWSIEVREVIYREEGFEDQLLNREREVQDNGRTVKSKRQGITIDIRKETNDRIFQER